MAATPEHAARVLGLDDDATLQDVRRVRRKMALKYHPDRSADPARASRHMARINAAADTLSSHLKKQKIKNARWVRPDYPDFSDRNSDNRSSARRETSDQFFENQNANTHACDEQTTRDLRPCVVDGHHASQNANRNDAVLKAERALIRLAKLSYTDVLARIGKRDDGPKVDVKVLSFS